MYGHRSCSGERPGRGSRAGVAAPVALGIVIILASLVFVLGCGSSRHGTPFPITGNFTNSSLNGQYAFILSGTRFSVTNGVTIQNAYQEAGVFTANGNGTITSGGEDVHVLGTFPGFTSAALSGSYSISKDGTGLITLNVGGGVETWTITMVSSSKFYLTEADATISAGANASGEAEQQDATVLGSLPSGTFAFRVHQKLATQPHGAMVGQFTVTGGSAVGQADVEQNGVLSSSAQSLSGTLATLDRTGRGTLTVNIGGAAASFNYYIVNATTLLLLESDANAFGLGRAEAQNMPFSATALSGSYTFGTSGDTQNNVAGVNSVGTLSVSGSTLSGNYDSNRDGTTIANQAFTGIITSFDPSTGRTAVSLTPTGAGLSIQEVWYLVSPTRAFSLVYYPNLPMVTEDGTLEQQVGAPFSNGSLKGQYAFLMGGYVGAGQLTRVGTFIPDGNGNLNINQSTNLYSAGSTTGNITIPPTVTVTTSTYLKGMMYTVGSNGRITESTNNLVLYLVSSSKAYVLEGDAGAQMFGPLEAQQ